MKPVVTTLGLLCMPSNQNLLEAIKPCVKRLSVCEPTIILPLLFSLEPLIAADDQPGNRLQQNKTSCLPPNSKSPNGKIF